MQVQCLKCKEPVDVKEANEFTRAYGVVCNKCRARYSEPPANEIPPASESSPESYEDASDLLTASSRNPPAMHGMAPPRLPPPPAPPAVKRDVTLGVGTPHTAVSVGTPHTAVPVGTPHTAVPVGTPHAPGEAKRALPTAKPRVFTRPAAPTEESAGPVSKRNPLDEEIPDPPPSSVGRIEDLRTMAAPPSSRHGRRVDEELVGLAGLSFDASEPPPPPVEEPAASATCPHCGKRPEDPPVIGYGLRRMRAALSGAAAADATLPGEGVHAPRGTDARSDGATPARPASLTPWAIAAASLVVALVAITTRRDVSTTSPASAAPPPRVESTARVVDRPGGAQHGVEGQADDGTSDVLLEPGAKPKETRAKSAPDKAAPDDPAPKAKATASAAAVSGAGHSFDRGAALAALAQAASQSGGCKKPGDPSGVAKVNVTFAPSGKATSAQINGPPFAGTSTGSCLARLFRTVTVPPFEGEPVSASKTLTIR